MVIERIIEIGQPAKIILFGSYVRGPITPDSDLAILVVAGDGVQNPRQESVRLRSAIEGIHMPIDIIVVNRTAFATLKNQVGMIYREADRHGQVVYERGSR